MLEVILDPRAREDLRALEKSAQRQVLKAVKNKLFTRPELFGVKLRGRLQDFWKLRVGDYRVGFIPGKKRVIIVAIGDRKDIYKKLERRIG